MAAQHPTSSRGVTAVAPEPRGCLLKILGVGFGVAVSMGATIGAGILRAPASIAGEVPYAAAILLASSSTPEPSASITAKPVGRFGRGSWRRIR